MGDQCEGAKWPSGGLAVAYQSASFLVLEGAGARPRNVPTKKYMYLYCASERLRNIYFQDSNTSAYIYNQCSFLLLLMVGLYGAIIKRHTDKTLTLRKIYEYASELRKFSHFHILKLLFPSIFCWYNVLHIHWASKTFITFTFNVHKWSSLCVGPINTYSFCWWH